MKGLHGIIFSYESHNDLRELTAHRLPASVPFAGRYRIIDFILSSMVNAGITDVGVVLHGNYQSLLDHLESGKDWDLSRTHGGLRLLPPFSYRDEFGTTRQFRGKMEALAGVRSYLEEIRQSHVVLADSDLVINIPLRDVYQAHLASGADITAVCTSNVDAPDDATYFHLDDNGRVKEALFGLRNPAGCHRSLEIYILSKQLLLDLVDECMSKDIVSFRGGVLLAKASELNIQSYVWDGYAAQIRSEGVLRPQPGAAGSLHPPGGLPPQAPHLHQGAQRRLHLRGPLRHLLQQHRGRRLHHRGHGGELHPVPRRVRGPGRRGEELHPHVRRHR